MKDEWQDGSFAEQWDSEGALRTNPDRPEQLDLLVSLLAGEHRSGDKILDLGSGSGQVEELLFHRLPDTLVVGVDFSAAMIALAERRLAVHESRFVPILGDFATLEAAMLPHREYRFIICVQALHEVPHAIKRRVFSFARSVLDSRGAFYVLDRFRYDADEFGADYRVIWERLNRRAGIAHPMSFQAYDAQYSAKQDHVAEVEEYCHWLAEADFHAACLWRHYNRALIAARPSGGVQVP